MLVQRLLSDVDFYLKNLSFEQRTAILATVQEDIQKMREIQPDITEAEIVKKLGPAPQVTLRYASLHGIKIELPRKRSPLTALLKVCIILTLVIGVPIGIAIFMFTPIMEVDESKGVIKFLGGNIVINSEEQTFQFGDRVLTGDKRPQSVEGNIDVQKLNIKELELAMNNIDITLRNSADTILNWDCTVHEKVTQDYIDHQQSSSKLLLKLDTWSELSCDFNIPQGLKITANASNGRMNFEELKNSIDASLTNGQISFRANQNAGYEFNTNVNSGVNAIFSNSGDQYKINLNVKKGRISNLDN